LLTDDASVAQERTENALFRFSAKVRLVTERGAVSRYVT
jgi:hypothetical protein